MNTFSHAKRAVLRNLFTIILAIFLSLLLAACGSPGTQSALELTASATSVEAGATPLSPSPVDVTDSANSAVTALPTDLPQNTVTPVPTDTRAPITAKPAVFSGRQAYEYVVDQMSFGPRWPGSPGHQEAGDYVLDRLLAFGWEVEEQTFPYQYLTGRNIIGRANQGKGPVVILGAHYDTRRVADQSPGSLASEPVPGAVDGASGVAVLLELARTLNLDEIDHEIWLAFFDLEDQGNGGMAGFDWIVGSTYMAEHLEVKPEAMVLVDMIGDADQQLYYEGNSDPILNAQIWDTARSLGYGDVFIPELRYTLGADDHLPFLRQGIPAIDIIDFDYPYWHTIQDTADKVSPESLERVGRTLAVWLENGDEAT